MTAGTVADAVVASLQAAEVDVVFTLCGNHILPLQEAMRDRGLRCVATRSEAAAVMAADAYGRVARRPGVALVTGGPGVGNAVTGLLTARGNQSPVVLISGEPSTAVGGRGAQQEADHVLLTAAATKTSLRAPRPDRALPLLREAFRVAEHGRPGPVHLSLPVDVQSAPLPFPIADVPSARMPVEAPVAPPGFVRTVADRVRGARRPVLIAGAGAWQHGGESGAAALARTCAVPLFSLDSARGIAPDSAPCACGSADPGINRAAAAIAAADLVVVAGRDIDFRLGYGAQFEGAATVVHVDLELAALGRNLGPDALLCAGDPGAFLVALAEQLGDHRPDEAWLARLAETDDDALPAAAQEEGGPLHPAAAADAIARAGIAAGAIFALDCGEFVQWCRQRIAAEVPGGWLRLGPQATCGAGLPFGLGARAARPDTPVIVIAGDGGIGYHVAELETAMRAGLSVVVVVGQDGAWGVERLLQTGLYGDDAAFTSDLTRPDFATVARGFGCTAVTAADARELEGAVREAVAAREPRLIQVGIRTVRSHATARMVHTLRTEVGDS